MRPSAYSPSRTSSRRRFSAWLALLLFVALVFWVYLRPAQRSAASTASAPLERTPAATPNHALGASAEPPANPRTTADSPAHSAAPGVIRTLTFQIDASGVHPLASVISPGRVKAPPIAYTSHRLEFDVRDAAGTVLYTGAVDDPRDAAFESASADGSLHGARGQANTASFALRLPSLPNGTELNFYEVNGTERTSRGTFALR